MNQVRDTEEVKMGFSIKSVCKKYFGIDVDYAGYICFDDNVWRSVKERRPLVLALPAVGRRALHPPDREEAAGDLRS